METLYTDLYDFDDDFSSSTKDTPLHNHVELNKHIEIQANTSDSIEKKNATTIVFKPNLGKIDLKLFVGQIPKDW